MGDAQRSHFRSSRQSDNPDELILIFTQAIYVPLTQDTSSSFPNIVHIFYALTVKVFIRVRDSMLPPAEDVRSCVKFFRYLHDQWHQVSLKFPVPVTRVLVQALALRVHLDLGEVDQDIEEMADLCDELLDSDISKESVTNAIAELARAINVHFNGHFEWNIRSENVTDCLRKAILHLPGLHKVTLLLAQSLLDRFEVSPLDDHYKGAMAIFDAIIMFRGSGDERSSEREEALYLAAVLADIRFHAYGKPEHLEHAIYRYRTLLDGTSNNGPYRAAVIYNLSQLEEWRLGGTANTRDALPFRIKSGKLPSFRELIAIFPGPMDVQPNPEVFWKHIDALQPFHINQLTDIADITDGIKYCRLLIVSYPRSGLDLAAQMALCVLLDRAFECTHKIEYLNEAISTTRNGINAVDLLTYRFALVGFLISLLSIRFALLRHKEDLDELMQLFPTAVGHSAGSSSGGLTASCNWATTARRFRHPSASTAYDHAMSLFQDSLTFAPTRDKQHSRLVATRSFHTVPLDYASYHIHSGRLEQAIETLERGRGLLWSEMRGLRTSIDQIRLVDSSLADKFSAVNRELEILTLTFSPNDNAIGHNNIEGMDPYGHSIMRKQKLLEDRENLITHIRALSGFDTFLKPPSFDTLRSAASHGTVVIINHCEWRSDILIIFHHNSPPSLIHTPDDFYTRANKLQDQLLAERKKGLESDAYEDALRAVLKELYELVGRPVIKRLNELNIPEQSRVWWCPTSVFCSLPLHAMGPIPSDVGPPRYFLDLYIPSYTPSLSALIDSHNPNSQTFEKPSMLLVIQPDATMIQALEEMKAVQGICPCATTLIGAAATPPIVLERLRDHRFVHIVCHGLLEPGKPFDSSFKLFEDKRLSLLNIVRSRLLNAEFAFLAACHTAELTDESPIDEALHLAAAMQYCGFRSVVGTMWAMADEDGRDLAGNFYKSVFSGGKPWEPYHERTAEALRDAVVRLRRKRRMTLERWVNYVHYGA